MDNGDFTHNFTSRGGLSCKGLGDNISNAGSSRCLSPASAVLGSDEGNEPSESYSIIIKELHDEIDRVQMSYKDIEAMIQAHMKPILDEMYAGASKLVTTSSALDESCLRKDQLNTHILLHIPSLQELLLKLGFTKNWEELQKYLMSSERTVLLSETDAVKLELRDAKSRHDTVIKSLHLSLRSAEQEYKSSQLTLQQKLRLSEQKLNEFEGQLLSLQQNLMCSNGRIQGLQKTLELSDKRLQSLHQALEESEKRGQSMQQILKDSQEKKQSLNHNLSSFEKNIQSLIQDLSASEKKVQLLQDSNWKSEERVKSLEQSLSSSKEKVSLLQESLKSSEERAQTLQQNLKASEENLQWMQHLLKTADEKSKALKETLRSSRGKSEALQEALGISESQIRAARAKQHSMEKSKEEQEDQIKSLMLTLRVSEEKHNSMVQDLQIGLQSAREKVLILQNALERTESGHVKEVEQLQHKLNRATRKLASTEQELHSQTVALNTQLLEEQSKTSKNLERSSRYQKEMQDTIKHLSMKLKIQMEKGEFALHSLKMCQKDLADVNRHLQGDLLRCNQVCGLENGPQKCGLKEELFNMRSSLNNILEQEVRREDQRRQNWIQVLDTSKEWETKVEKLVASLGYFQSKSLLKQEGNDSHKNIEEALRTGTSCIPLYPSAMLQRNLSTRPTSPYLYRNNLGQERYLGSSTLQCLKNSDSIQHLLTDQKRLINLQSVEFQSNLKGLLRMS